MSEEITLSWSNLLKVLWNILVLFRFCLGQISFSSGTFRTGSGSCSRKLFCFYGIQLWFFQIYWSDPEIDSRQISAFLTEFLSFVSDLSQIIWIFCRFQILFGSYFRISSNTILSLVSVCMFTESILSCLNRLMLHQNILVGFKF